ncbi:MAG: translation initiation factor IF-2 N-terminal domain-containing protein, partial [Actinomycetota bacterium]
MSNKVRVYELAKETGLSNKEVLRRLGELDIPVKSHSSSVTIGDAARFRESLGKTEEERAAEERAKREREQQELERYRSMQAAAPPEKKKAAKVLPPHLREQQAKQESAAPAAERSDAPTTGEAAEGSDAVSAATSDAPTTAPSSTDEDAGAESGGDEAAGGAKRMPGAPPPRLKPGEAPLRPPSRTQAPPTVTGEGPEVKRRQDPTLPREGSGERSIPPPLRKAPPRPQPQPGPSSDRGAP